MSAHDSQREAFLAEFERLGLDWREFPFGGLAMGGDLGDFLERLRGMPLGSTWREVFPDIPAHWIENRPETWTRPYRPLGPYDYQDAPGSFTVHVWWTPREDVGRLEALVDEARRSGWPVHGAGLIATVDAVREADALIVLERGTSEERGHDFITWLEQHPGLHLAAIPRLGTEKYVA